MNYEVDSSVLDSSGRKATAIAEDIQSVLPDVTLQDVPAALPGSISAGIASMVDNQWKSSGSTLQIAIQMYAEKLVATARDYAEIESANQQRAWSIFGGGR